MKAVRTAGIVLAAVSAAALAQYSASDPRSTIYNNESLRREDEIKRNEEAGRSKATKGNSSGGRAPRAQTTRAVAKPTKAARRGC